MSQRVIVAWLHEVSCHKEPRPSVHALRTQNNCPAAREARVRNRPTFRLSFARNCLFLKVLPALSGVDFTPSYFAFTPCLRIPFVPHFFVCSRAKVGANF